MRTIKLCSVVFGTGAFCHKQDSLTRGATAFVDRETRTTHKYYNLYSTVGMLTTRDVPAVIDATSHNFIHLLKRQHNYTQKR